jgi:hypothetical protein
MSALLRNTRPYSSWSPPWKGQIQYNFSLIPTATSLANDLQLSKKRNPGFTSCKWFQRISVAQHYSESCAFRKLIIHFVTFLRSEICCVLLHTLLLLFNFLLQCNCNKVLRWKYLLIILSLKSTFATRSGGIGTVHFSVQQYVHL